LTLGRQDRWGQTGFGWLRIGSGGRLFFDKLSNNQLFKEHPAPWSKLSTFCSFLN
jgi:hypothetical protein